MITPQSHYNTLKNFYTKVSGINTYVNKHKGIQKHRFAQQLTSLKSKTPRSHAIKETATTIDPADSAPAVHGHGGY